MPSYRELLAADFETALAFIDGFAFDYRLNTPFIHNVLADSAYQNRKAQDELNKLIATTKHLLDDIGDIQIRLSQGERCIRALQGQLLG